MNTPQLTLADIVLIVLVAITIVVPLALYIATFWSIKAAVILYTSESYLMTQIVMWVLVDVTLIFTAFTAPDWFYSKILLFGIGLPAPVLYWDLLRFNRLQNEPTAPAAPHSDEHGAYDGDFIPGHERHDL